MTVWSYTRIKKEKNAAITSAHFFMKKLDQAHTKTKENTTVIETDRRARPKLKTCNAPKEIDRKIAR